MSYPEHSLPGPYSLQRSSQCILQPKPTGKFRTGDSLSDGLVSYTRWGKSLTHLQRCSQCVLQLQLTGQFKAGDSLSDCFVSFIEMLSVYYTAPPDWAWSVVVISAVRITSICQIDMLKNYYYSIGILMSDKCDFCTCIKNSYLKLVIN